MDERPGSERQRRTGWVFVALQVVLLVSLIALPDADHWPVPGWLSGLGLVVLVTGLGLVGVAARGLGPALTPTPVPTEGGSLATNGLYGRVRHPIYSGLLLAVTGVTVASGNVAVLAVAVVAVVFFSIKAGWEERRLAERYPGYADYAARTPRFVPRLVTRGDRA